MRFRITALWVIPVALITGHTIAYRHNVNLFK